MSIINLLNGMTPDSAEIADAVDLDGANDYYSRASDLSGNADGKTFTFSAFVYRTENAVSRIYYNGPPNVSFYLTATGQFYILGENSSGTNILDGVTTNVEIPLNTFCSVIASIDLNNPSNRHVYVNDQPVAMTWNIYTNDDIDFTSTTHLIGALGVSSQLLEGRLGGHLFLDYTYRDLSVEANRRLFINEDLTPAPIAGLSALSPIILMDYSDVSTAMINLGTGGDFTQNGVIAQSGRGPAQYNPAASTFDGSADYLSSSSIIGISDGKKLTISFNYKVPYDGGTHYVFCMGTAATSNDGFVRLAAGGTGYGLVITFKNSAGTVIASFLQTSNEFIADKYNSVQISFDLTSASNRHVIVNGVAVDGSWSTYTNDTIDLTYGANNVQASAIPNVYGVGELSDFWLEDSYIDLSASNPFYDTDTGKAKYLGELGELPTGTQPLIYLPLYGNDAGSNLGSGGDFTVNSGPFTGARGFNEVWADSAESDGSTGYLSRTSALAGASDGGVVSFVIAYNADAITTKDIMFGIRLLAGTYIFQIGIDASGNITMDARNSGLSDILNSTSPGGGSGGSGWHTVMGSFDLSSASNRSIYIDGSLSSTTWSTYTNDDIVLSSPNIDIFCLNAGDFFDGKIGFLWFSTEYIDFSDEANRLKFFDAFNYPVDVGEDGSLPTGTAPILYMNNDFYLGTDSSGNGNDFSVNGTVTDGGQVYG